MDDHRMFCLKENNIETGEEYSGQGVLVKVLLLCQRVVIIV